jgi:hypothetical protein
LDDCLAFVEVDGQVFEAVGNNNGLWLTRHGPEHRCFPIWRYISGRNNSSAGNPTHINQADELKNSVNHPTSRGK